MPKHNMLVYPFLKKEVLQSWIHTEATTGPFLCIGISFLFDAHLTKVKPRQASQHGGKAGELGAVCPQGNRKSKSTVIQVGFKGMHGW